MTATERYQKAHEENFKQQYPSAYNDGHYAPPKMPKIKTANGMQAFCTNYCNWLGHHLERTNNMGVPVKKKIPKFNIFSGKLEHLDGGMEWRKGTGAKGSNYAYWQSFEYMFVFSKGTPKTVNRIADKLNPNKGKLRGSNGSEKLNEINTRTERKNIQAPAFSVRENVWKYNVGQNDNTDHPAVFPEKLAADHIYSWSKEGDLVYDCFGGSGTTAKMAHIQKRNWILSEISSEYVQIAEKRLAPYLAQTSLF